MRNWTGPLAVLLLAIAVPLLAPPSWGASPWLPDVALLAVVYLGFLGTPDRAAVCGIVLGAALSLWSPEPIAFRAFVLGSAGWLSGQVAGILHRDSAVVRMFVAAGAMFACRAAETIEASLACRGGTSWTGADAAHQCGAVFVACAVTAVAAPMWFAFVRSARLLAPLERTFRDV